MSNSSGRSFPTSGVSIGHEHYDLATEQLYVFKGGDVTNLNNWEQKIYKEDVDEDFRQIQGWNDVTISAFSTSINHATAPVLTLFRNGIYLLAFTGTGVVQTDAYFVHHMPHDYMAGTAIYPHVHWTHNNANPSGNVKWQIEYTVAKGFQLGVFPASTTVSVIQAAGVQYTHHIAEVIDSDVIPAANLEPDALILFHLFRDPADVQDTFEDNAFLITMDLHYQSDMIMTNEKRTPFTKDR